MRISIVNQQTEHKWEKRWETPIRKAINNISKKCNLPAPTEVNVVVVDRSYIQELNFVFRGQDKPTDVLSFSLTEIGEDEPLYEVPEKDHMLGDIIICLDAAISQAREYQHSIERELTYLTVHGMLHLLGYDHEEESERILMRSLEEKIMRELGLSR